MTSTGPSQSARNELFNQNYLCPACNNTVEDDESILATIGCDGTCRRFYHKQCANLSDEQFNYFNIHTNEEWICAACNHDMQQDIGATTQHAQETVNTIENTASLTETDTYPNFRPANTGNPQQRTSMEWGCLKGYDNIDNALNDAYNEVVIWRKNFFQVPFGTCGKTVVEEATRLLSLFNSRGEWEGLALKAVMVFLPLMIQKPAKNSQDKRSHSSP